MNNNVKEVLASYVDALFPIIYVNHFDFKVVDEMIGDIADRRKIIEFSNGLGIVNFLNKSLEKECELKDFLDYVKDDGYDYECFLILKDIHNQLDDVEIISRLKYIASRNLDIEEYNTTIFIVSSKLKIPAELEDYITVFDIKLPSIIEIKKIIFDFIKDLHIDVKDDVLSELALSFKGLNEFQIKQILNLAYQDGGCIDSDDKQLILSQKEQLIKKAGLLEMIQVKESISDIGGLENLKDWLYRKECVFDQLDKAINYGVDVPKGIMIVGMPGCGKSLAAKATATLFEIPLVRLDVGRLLGKYVGESEENMRNALRLAEAISPCVLWIDEIEKAFSGVGSGGSDVTTRLFGQFLTWMQEKENTVFIVATANDISHIPPEFLRKGRFDELFFVDFPNKQERKKIIEIHLKKRNKWNSRLNIIELVKVTEGYNGADLEAIVKDAIENSFIAGNYELTTEDLLKAQKNIKSISKTLESRIKEIRTTIEKMDLKPSSRDDDTIAVPYTRKEIRKKINTLDKDNEPVIEKNEQELNNVMNFVDYSDLAIKFYNKLDKVYKGGMGEDVYKLAVDFLANGNYCCAFKAFEYAYKKGHNLSGVAYNVLENCKKIVSFPFVRLNGDYTDEINEEYNKAREFECELKITEAIDIYRKLANGGVAEAKDDYQRLGGQVLDRWTSRVESVYSTITRAGLIERLTLDTLDELYDFAKQGEKQGLRNFPQAVFKCIERRSYTGMTHNTARKSGLFPDIMNYNQKKEAYNVFKLGVAYLKARNFDRAESEFTKSRKLVCDKNIMFWIDFCKELESAKK